MKKLICVFATLLMAGSLSFGQLFPKVDKIASPESSMLVFQLGKKTEGKYEKVSNISATGWLPILENSVGELVQFRTFGGALANVLHVYYAENLKPGKYTLKGFQQFYVDYGILEKMKQEQGKDIMIYYRPYENNEYHLRHDFPLPEVIEFELAAGTVMSLGTYIVEYQMVGGWSGTTDDRWKVKEESFKYLTVDPKDEYPLRYIKSWASPRWKKWNAINPATKLSDEEYIKEYF